jgi:hypothetical protein
MGERLRSVSGASNQCRRALACMNAPDPDLASYIAVVPHEPLLTAVDVAALLAVPRSSVYEYARRSSDPLPPIGVASIGAPTAATSNPGSRD